MKSVWLIGLVLSASTAIAAPLETQTLSNGVKISYIKKGTGQKPLATQQVEVHYEGRLESGQVFDSSYARGKPVTFPLNQVIPCWTTGVASIPVGSTVELSCPAATAYGERGVPGRIAPNSPLIFKVELLSIR